MFDNMPAVFIILFHGLIAVWFMTDFFKYLKDEKYFLASLNLVSGVIYILRLYSIWQEW